MRDEDPKRRVRDGSRSNTQKIGNKRIDGIRRIDEEKLLYTCRATGAPAAHMRGG